MLGGPALLEVGLEVEGQVANALPAQRAINPSQQAQGTPLTTQVALLDGRLWAQG